MSMFSDMVIAIMDELATTEDGRNHLSALDLVIAGKKIPSDAYQKLQELKLIQSDDSISDVVRKKAAELMPQQQASPERSIVSFSSVLPQAQQLSR